MRPSPLLIAAALIALAPAARADRVHLTNGRTIEGEVREEGDHVVVRTDHGAEVRLPRERVREIEAAPTPRARFEARLDALDPEDRAGHHALADWCEAEGLEDQAEQVRRAILARWPDDAAARRALDHVRHEGRWITRAEYMEGLGLVPGDAGRTWITPEAAAEREALAAARAKAPELRSLLREADEEPEAAAAKLATYEDLAAVPVLEEHLGADALATRVLAMQELGRRRATRAALRLARAAVEDARRPARQAALAALGRLPEADPDLAPRLARYFTAAVGRSDVFQRVHAVEAVGAFPSPGAVPVLIARLRESASGFGRVSLSVTTQRAYIRDFELTSGGAGATVAEVADPSVDTFSEGAVLDVRVVQWERETIVRVLRRITGQDLGPEPEAWERWWREEGGR